EDAAAESDGQLMASVAHGRIQPAVARAVRARRPDWLDRRFARRLHTTGPIRPGGEGRARRPDVRRAHDGACHRIAGPGRPHRDRRRRLSGRRRVRLLLLEAADDPVRRFGPRRRAVVAEPRLSPFFAKKGGCHLFHRRSSRTTWPSSGNMSWVMPSRTACSEPGRMKIAVPRATPAAARVMIAALPISW